MVVAVLRSSSITGVSGLLMSVSDSMVESLYDVSSPVAMLALIVELSMVAVLLVQ